MQKRQNCLLLPSQRAGDFEGVSGGLRLRTGATYRFGADPEGTGQHSEREDQAHRGRTSGENRGRTARFQVLAASLGGGSHVPGRSSKQLSKTPYTELCARASEERQREKGTHTLSAGGSSSRTTMNGTAAIAGCTRPTPRHTATTLPKGLSLKAERTVTLPFSSRVGSRRPATPCPYSGCSPHSSARNGGAP